MICGAFEKFVNDKGHNIDEKEKEREKRVDPHGMDKRNHICMNNIMDNAMDALVGVSGMN